MTDAPPPVPGPEQRPAADPVAVATIVVGCIGIVVFGLLLAVVTGFLAAVTGQRAQRAGRSLDNAYIGLGLAGVDGIVWIVLHLLLDLNFVAG